MAEKRAVDRCILKLLNAHAYLYSDIEADEFKQSKDEQIQQKTNTNNNNGGGGYAERLEKLLPRLKDGTWIKDVFCADRMSKHEQYGDDVRWSEKQVAILEKAERDHPATDIPF